MTLTQAISKAKKESVIIEETVNGHYFFTKDSKKGSAWLEEGVFDLPRKIHTDETSSDAYDMKDLFRYLSK